MLQRKNRRGAHGYEAGENVVINPHNITNVIIEKTLQSDVFSSVPLRLSGAATNNVLSSFRNGPVKAGVGSSSNKPIVKTAAKQPTKMRNPTPVLRARPGSAKLAPQQAAKRPQKQQQRPASAQRARPASPGLRGKTAEAPKSHSSSIRSIRLGRYIK